MSRQAALERAAEYFDNGSFVADLTRKVAFQTVSESEGSEGALRLYLEEEVTPELEALGCSCHIVANPVAGCGPYLIAERIEDAGLPTVLMYAHGDVVQGQDASWREGLSPWTLRVDGDRIYGRGTADNKGQFVVNIGALRATLAARGGRLGFNLRFLIESAEERGSPGSQ